LLIEVRNALNKGLALGTETFRNEVEAISDHRLRHLKPGPKPTRKNRMRVALSFYSQSAPSFHTVVATTDFCV
jgi:hypothetical protein